MPVGPPTITGLHCGEHSRSPGCLCRRDWRLCSLRIDGGIWRTRSRSLERVGRIRWCRRRDMRSWRLHIHISMIPRPNQWRVIVKNVPASPGLKMLAMIPVKKSFSHSKQHNQTYNQRTRIHCTITNNRSSERQRQREMDSSSKKSPLPSPGERDGPSLGRRAPGKSSPAFFSLWLTDLPVEKFAAHMIGPRRF